jgi:oligosaccharide repeat unit polymerase
LSSFAFLCSALATYFFLAHRTRDWLAPSALLCLFWFGAASLADVTSLKDLSLQGPWELETYAAIYLCGLSMFAAGLLQRRQQAIQPIRSEPSALFRNATAALMLLSIAAVIARLYVFGFSLERLILDFGGADLKTDMDAIPGVFYFEIMTPFLSLCAMFELSASRQMSRFRRTALALYVLYTVVIYCAILSASRGTLLVILTGALYLYTQNGRLRFIHLLTLGALLVAAMSGLSFLRMSSESVSNSFLGDGLFLTFLSPIYTYVAFNFENFNSLVRADLQPTYILYALKFVLWPVFKFDYESGAIRLTDFDTLFFNARTFLYPFYHDLGLVGCVLYPGLISLVITVLRNSVAKNPAGVILLMGLQKPIWFAFFGNYFFGELSVFIPLLVLGLLSAIYPTRGARVPRGPRRSSPDQLN